MEREQDGGGRKSAGDGDAAAGQKAHPRRLGSLLSLHSLLDRTINCCARVADFAAGLVCRGGVRASEPAGDGSATHSYGSHGSAGTVMMVRVHYTDPLADDPYIVHPLVRVHIVDAVTGKLLRRDTATKGGDAGATQYREYATRVRHQTGAHGARTSRVVVGGSEDGDERLQHILPLMTEPADLAASSSQYGATPVWGVGEDAARGLLFNEDFDHLLRRNALLLFELLDFGPAVPYSKVRCGDGFYRIAWGFLRLVQRNGAPNVIIGDRGARRSDVSKRRRLQLYKYGPAETWRARQVQQHWERSHEDIGLVPGVFHCFRRRQRSTYPSTLYVTVEGARRPELKRVTHRPVFPTERQSHEVTYDHMKDAGVHDLADLTSPHGSGGNRRMAGAPMSQRELSVLQKQALRRVRHPNEPCRVPAKLAYRIGTGMKMGCFALRFSGDGNFLAAACVGEMDFPVRVYDAQTGRLVATFSGHRSLVYDMSWSVNSDAIVTASADGRACVWSLGLAAKGVSGTTLAAAGPDGGDAKNVPARASQSRARKGDGARPVEQGLILALQHAPPCYVYCCCFHPVAVNPPLVVTGAYDCSVRLWTITAKLPLGSAASGSAATNQGGRLNGGRNDHESHVTACAFDDAGVRLFTGSGDGVVKVWRLTRDQEPANPASWQNVRTLVDNVLKGNCITSISVNPVEKEMLVHAQKNCLRVFELSARYPLARKQFLGVHCQSSMVRSCFSPDGRYVVSGSEAGRACFWRAATGAPVRSSACGALGYGRTLCDVSWHPKEHLVAMCCFGGDYPILLFEAEHAHGTNSGGYDGNGEHNARSLNNARFAAPPQVGGGRERRRAQFLQDKTKLLNDRLNGLETQTLTSVRHGAMQKIGHQHILKPVGSLRTAA